jgi:hypothetical protein
MHAFQRGGTGTFSDRDGRNIAGARALNQHTATLDAGNGETRECRFMSCAVCSRLNIVDLL